ncbi:MAG TPA: hypothetical protein VF174_08935 [Micromonosporaceae bacterium]
MKNGIALIVVLLLGLGAAAWGLTAIDAPSLLTAGACFALGMAITAVFDRTFGTGTRR